MRKDVVPNHLVTGALPFTIHSTIIIFEFSFPHGIQSSYEKSSFRQPNSAVLDNYT